jgi:membrane protease YdiL (CAAX protease family)
MALAVYPLLEEWVFRAGILRWLDLRSQKASECYGDQAGPALASTQRVAWFNNVLTSLLFSAMHLWSWPLAHAAAVFVPSLLLGWLWQWRQRLWLCVLVHAAMNTVGLALIPWLVRN